MATGFNLKYGEEYEKMPEWEQFTEVMNCARGRKNMFVFRVINALINELGLKNADGFQTLNAIEYWASERLSAKPQSLNRKMTPGSSSTSVPSIVAEPVTTEPASLKETCDEHNEHSETDPINHAPEQVQNAPFFGLDMSAFMMT